MFSPVRPNCYCSIWCRHWLAGCCGHGFIWLCTLFTVYCCVADGKQLLLGGTFGRLCLGKVPYCYRLLRIQGMQVCRIHGGGCWDRHSVLRLTVNNNRLDYGGAGRVPG